MYVNTGMKHGEDLEKLPYFNKQTAGILLEKEGINLDRKIERLLKAGIFLRLKNGLYTTRAFLLAVRDQEEYGVSLVPVLYFPSYLSLEYILSQTGLIPEAVRSYTGITTKSTREFANFLGRFRYQNINEKLFCGFAEGKASKAKALFDYLYLKSNLGADLQKELAEDLRINWANFSRPDLKEFNQYIKISGSKKMIRIGEIITGILK